MDYANFDEGIPMLPFFRSVAFCLAAIFLLASTAAFAKSPRHKEAMMALKAACAQQYGLQFEQGRYVGPPQAKRAFRACLGKTEDSGGGREQGSGGGGGPNPRARESIKLCAPDRMRLCGTTDRNACPLRQRLSELSPACRERVLEFMQKQ